MKFFEGLNGYFYWFGVVVNVLIAIGIVVAFVCSIADGIEDRKYWKHVEEEKQRKFKEEMAYYGTSGQSDIAKEEIGEHH